MMGEMAPNPNDMFTLTAWYPKDATPAAAGSVRVIGAIERNIFMQALNWTAIVMYRESI